MNDSPAPQPGDHGHRRSQDAGARDGSIRRENRPPPANVGRLLLSAFELFADEIVSGIRERGFPEFRYSDTQVLRNLDPEGTRITELAERVHMTDRGLRVTEAARATDHEVVESWSDSLGREELERLL